MTSQYTAAIFEHFCHPRNYGILPAPEVAYESRAAASILTELIQGPMLQEVVILPQEVLLTALHTAVRPARVKCALLPLHALQAGIAAYLA